VLSSGPKPVEPDIHPAKLANFYLRSMPWIAASRKREGAASVSAACKNCRPTRVMTVDFRVCRSCNLCDRRSARHDGHVASPLSQMLHRIFTMPADGQLYLVFARRPAVAL
jgi:hypothetical protein